MSKNNCYMYLSDMFMRHVYTREEADSNFGNDMVEEFGSKIPTELIKRFKKNYEEFQAIQEELRKHDKN